MDAIATDLQAVNALRFLSVDMIEKAKSGHSGLPIDAAPMAYVLWEKIMQFNPDDPEWINRDRFVLSAGHGSALLYSLLHFNQFGLTIDDVQKFRQLGSKTPGHPEYGHTAGVDATTGPLAQGLGMGVGMAMAEKHLATLYNQPDFKVIDHYTYVLVGDGDLMEGLSQEAINIAGDKRLNKLIVLYDSNNISLDGQLDLSTSEDEQERFEGANWDYQLVVDGNNLNQIQEAINRAKLTDRPSLIEVKTIIGYGTPLAGTNKVHGAAIGEENVTAMRHFYDWQYAPFEFSPDIYQTFEDQLVNKHEVYAQWQQMFERYQHEFPQLATQLDQPALKTDTLQSQYEVGDEVATRTVSSEMMQLIAKENPNFWGGSADLSSSNKTYLNDDGEFNAYTPAGRNVHYGVREFGMAAAMNGIALHGGSRTFGSTFLIFSDYLKAAVRLAALQKLPVTYVFSHDSLAVGEDGPTHEPVEQVTALRTIPGVNVLRPADANETVAAWQLIATTTDQPSVLITSRQKLPTLAQTKQAPVDKGGYVLSPAVNENPDGILIATGSEVHLALEAQAALRQDNFDVSVISMPSINLFEQQSAEYKNSVLKPDVKLRIAVEMLDATCWYKYVGLQGAVIGNQRFGASGKGPEVIDAYGFTVTNIVKKFKSIWSANEQ